MRVARKAILNAAGASLIGMGAASAQTQPAPYEYGPHMMWGWAWYGMFFGPLFMLLVLAAVIAAVVLAARWLGGPWHAAEPPHYPPPSRTAIDILNERLARGEIDQAEYEAKRRLISQG